MVTIAKTPKVFNVRVFGGYPYLRILTNLRGNTMFIKLYTPSYKSITLGKVNLNVNEVVKITKIIWQDTGKSEYCVSIYRGNELMDSVWFSTVEKAHRCFKALLVFETLIK